MRKYRLIADDSKKSFFEKKRKYKNHYRVGIMLLWVFCLCIISLGVFSYSPDKGEEKTFDIVPQVRETSPAAKIVASVDKYAWPNGTDREKWDYDTGGFKDDSVRDIYAVLGYDDTDYDSDYTPCNHFVDVAVYAAIGEKISIMPEDPYEDWGELPSSFKIVHEGPIEDFELKPGDIVRYKKNKKGGWRSQHAFIYYGDGLIAEAGIRTRYPVVYSEYYGSDIVKWERDEVDQDTIQVIRVK